MCEKQWIARPLNLSMLIIIILLTFNRIHLVFSQFLSEIIRFANVQR